MCGVGVVPNVYVEPHHAGNAENVYKIDGQKYAKQTERHRLAPTESPVKNADKKQAKPGSPTIRNKHGAIVVARLRKVVQVATRAPLPHIERFDERPGTCFKRVGFLTARAFVVENAVCFGSFFKHGVA